MNKKKSLYFFISVLVILLFIIIVVAENNYSISPFLPLLPFLYLFSFIIIIIKRPNALKSVSVLAILSTFFIRIVVVPAIYVLSEYSSKISINSFNINNALLLQMWEFFCVFIMLLSSKQISNIVKNKNKIENIKMDKLKIITKFSIYFLIIIAIFCLILDRNVLVGISTVLNRFLDTKDELIARRVLYFEIKSKSSLLLNVFIQVVYYLQILIPAYLISTFAQKKDYNNNKGYYMILFVSLASTFFVTENNSDSICIMIACLIVLYNLYIEKMKKILPILGILLFTFVILFLFSKSGILTNDIGFKNISIILCAYFSALPNIGIAFLMNYSDKFLTFLGDIISGVPYLIAIFKDYPQSVYIYNETLYGYKGMTDQIMPLISYGYQFLGILAPLLTILVYKLAFHFEIKSNESNSAFNKVLYSLMFISLSVGPCIYGLPSIIRRICLFIPLILLINFNKRSRKSLEKK